MTRSARCSVQALLSIALLMATGCTFGGGSGPDSVAGFSPGEGAASGGRGGSEGGAASGGGMTSGGTVGTGGAAELGGQTGGEVGSGGSLQTGGVGGTVSSGGVASSGGGVVTMPSDGGMPESGSCGAARPAVQGCDPALGTGCPAEMQCAVDAVAAKPTGYCVFSSPLDGGMCFSSGVTESCPAGHFCAFNECREVCLCNSDCSTGRCCGDPVGAGGFKLCGDC